LDFSVIKENQKMNEGQKGEKKERENKTTT